jgi:predicted transcriptional regulator of viral defense system
LDKIVAMNEELIRKFNQNGGYIRNPGKLTRSEKYQIQLALKAGIISRIKRGLYRLSDIPSAYQEGEVAQIVKAGVFCMFTAWAHYELTTSVSPEYHIAVPKSMKIIIPDYPPIRIYYWNKYFYEIGITEVEIGGQAVKMYDIERSVCDAVRFRNKIGTDVFSEILRNYVRRDDRNMDKLLKYATSLRISHVLNQLIQVMV